MEWAGERRSKKKGRRGYVGMKEGKLGNSGRDKRGREKEGWGKVAVDEGKRAHQPSCFHATNHDEE